MQGVGPRSMINAFSPNKFARPKKIRILFINLF